MAIHGILTPIDLEDGDGAVTVDFIAGRVFGWAFKFVSPGHVIRVHVFEAEFADVENAITAVFFRVRGGIPSLDFVTAEVNAFDF